MPIRPTVIYPDKRLREPTVKVTAFGPGLDPLLKDMEDSMLALDGVGIAANQIGVSKRIFVLNCVATATWEDRGRVLVSLGTRPIENTDPPMVFINPEVISSSKEEVNGEEGCLSFPGVMVWVERSQALHIRAYDRDGKEFEAQASGLWARAIQHEMDHINGVLLIDKVGVIKKASIKKKMAKLAR